MRILSVQTAIPVYVKLDDPNATVLVMVDHASRTVDIPDPDHRSLVTSEEEFARLLFEYYDSLNTFKVEVPSEVYSQYERSYAAAEAKKAAIREMSNEL